jgi:hypothetical protein
MSHISSLLPIILAATLMSGAMPPSNEVEELYWVSRHDVILFRNADRSQPYLSVRFREPVYRLGTEQHWSRVRTQDGAEGYVESAVISNVWIRVSKSRRTVYVYRGSELVRAFPADLGHNAFADKVRRGSDRNPDDWRTPEGDFFVVAKNARSQFYKAFVLNYPTAADAHRGLAQGLISEREAAAIIDAERNWKMPPMNTRLGGWIEIHGQGTGARSDWTMGCVAVRDEHMDAVWLMVDVGTPVRVEP